MRCQSTLLDLVTVVSKTTRTEAELIAVVAYLVNSGRVRLCGSFSGARFDLSTRPGKQNAAAAIV